MRKGLFLRKSYVVDLLAAVKIYVTDPPFKHTLEVRLVTTDLQHQVSLLFI